MSQVKAALESLELAHTGYKQHKLLLEKALNATNKNERAIKNKMQSLSNALREVNASYTCWASRSGLSDEALSSPTEKYNTGWLENLWGEVDSLQDQVDEYLETEHPVQMPPANHQMQSAKGQFESLKMDISSRIQTLLSKTSPTEQILNAATVTVYEGILSETCKLLTVNLPMLVDKISDLDPANVIAYHEELEHFKREHQTHIITIRTYLADQLNVNSAVPSTPSLSKSIEMEKSKAPSFSGDTLDYPEFKRGWEKVPGVHWDDANQVEQIKYKVNAETRLLISRCNTMEEVWRVLDDEYAQEEEVVNSVNAKLKSLRLMECSVPEYIVKLRNYLPSLEVALLSVNGFEL